MENIRSKEACVYLTIRDVQKILNISQATAYQLSQQEHFPVCRIGRSIRIPRDTFFEWLNAITHIPGNQK